MDISVFLGKTATSIENLGDELIFTFSDNTVYKLYHEGICCESVTLEDICGDLNDLIGSELLISKEVSSNDNLPLSDTHDSYTWTFYKLATIKGYVTLRWYGVSNGCYSEQVDLIQIK